MQIVLRIFLLLFLLYPVSIGFVFSSKDLGTKKRIAFGLIAIFLAITNMIVVVATYFGAFLNDSWFTFITFFIFQISLLVSVIAHIVMVIKKDYRRNFAKVMAIVLLVFGFLFSLFLILFSRPEVTSGEGIEVSNALLTLLPALLSSSFFIIAGTDRDVFETKKNVPVSSTKNKSKHKKYK